jgi:hypothetical protein
MVSSNLNIRQATPEDVAKIGSPVHMVIGNSNQKSKLIAVRESYRN